MTLVTIRYESQLNNFLTRPFEIGLRHLKVAFGDGSLQKLEEMARERIIYRSMEKEKPFSSLTVKERVIHLITGTLETAGYLAFLPSIGYTTVTTTVSFATIPFVVSFVDRFLFQHWYPKGCYGFSTHMEEGGHHDTTTWRKNPFDPDGHEDPFYKNATWIKKEK